MLKTTKSLKVLASNNARVNIGTNIKSIEVLTSKARIVFI